MTLVVRDISPDQSGLDGANPNGASGGRVNGLGVDRTAPARVCGERMGRSFRSLDNGLTWAHLDGHVPTATWGCRGRSDELQSSVCNVVLRRPRRTAGQASNVSTDGGVTWTHPPSATPPVGFCTALRRTEPSAFGISIDPANANRVFIWHQLRARRHRPTPA